MVGVCNCISYQMEGKDNSRCGSLQSIGAPLAVFVPLTAQLLLPLFGLGLNSSFTCTVVSFSKYKESAVTGFTVIIPGAAKAVPFGTMGSKESGTWGNSCFISS